MLKGIDVSRWQGHIDTAQVAQQGYSFGIVEAQYGTDTPNPLFREQYDGFKAVGMVCGAYQYALPGHASAQAHVHAFVDVVTQFDGLPPVLDIEVTDGLDDIKLIAWCREWANATHVIDRRKPILYASAAFIKEHGLTALFDTFLLWLADYESETPTEFAWTFWQHSPTGVVAGIQAEVDLNVFHGSVIDLIRLCSPTVIYDPVHIQINGEKQDQDGLMIQDNTFVSWTSLRALDDKIEAIPTGEKPYGYNFTTKRG